MDTDDNAPARLALFAEENSALIDNALDLLALLGPDGRFLRVNAAARELLGYDPGALIGRHYSELVHPDDRERALAIDTSLRSTAPTLHDIRLRYLRKDGGTALMSFSVRWSETLQRSVATARDITEQANDREALRQTTERLNSMLESIGDAFFAIGADWRITYANRKAGEFAGIDIATAIGRHLVDLVPDLEGTETLARYRNAMASGQACTFEVYWAPLDVWIEVRAYPIEGGLSVYFHEITAKRHAEAAVRASEQRFREVIAMTPAGYLFAGPGGQLQDVNPALCALSGYERDALLGLRVEDLFLAFPWHSLADDSARAAPAQGLEAVIRHRAGHHVHVLLNGSLQRDASGAIVSLTGLMSDITARKLAESRLQDLATHDTLTGLPNRALLGERVQQLLDRCPHGSSVAVMFLDLDRFKEINDSFGHEMGDVLLCEVATRLRSVIRPDDVIARLGGDEFVVAARCSTGKHAAGVIAEKLLDALTLPVSVGDHEVIAGASIGISMYPVDAQTKEVLFQTADTAMYRAKSAGRNRFRFFEPEMTVETKVRMALEVSLRPALSRGEFELHYQPRVDLRTMQLYGLEALIRWNHPEHGRVSPQQFIAIAEETGLIVSIGRWVMMEACTQTRRLMDEYQRPVRVSVNVSARQLAQPNFGAEVREVLARTGLPPECLELELTESALIEDIERTAKMLRELKTLGILIAVDDFGTGYSGLAYLRRFPIDVLKLDRSFVLQQDETITTFDFVKAFVDMAHALNMSVVAEGVETAEVLAFLRAAECDQAQGYYLARPMPLGQLRELMASEPELRLAG